MFAAAGVRVAQKPHGPSRLQTSAGTEYAFQEPSWSHDGRSIAYSTDFNAFTADMLALFRGVDVWIVDALRRRPHPSHGHLDQVLGWIALVQPRRAILTHMDQSMDYDTLCRSLPESIEPGYDGLEVIV